MRHKIYKISDNDSNRSKQNCQVICDSNKASKHRRKIIRTLEKFKCKYNRIIKYENGVGKNTVVTKVIER